MVAKGRQAKGEKNGGAKLTEEQVIEIKRLTRIRTYGTQLELAKKYGVDKNTINRIAKGKSWQ